MAKNRFINTKFWSDSYVSELDPVEKLLFLYLLTNEKTSICGIYELPLKYMAIETGIEKEMIEKILKRFQEEKKIFYYKGWIFIANFIKHQNFENINIKKGMQICFSSVPLKILNEINTSGGFIDESYMSHIGLSHNYNSNLNFNFNLNTKKNKEEILSPFPTDGKLSMKEQRQIKKYSRMEKEKEIIDELFLFWNSLKIIVHPKMRKKMKSELLSKLKDYTKEQIKQSMKNYAFIVNSEDYYFQYKWCLEDFLSRGEGKNIEKFLDLEIAKQNYAKDKQSNGNAGIII